MKIRSGKSVGALALAAVFVAYAAGQIILWGTPWSSWGHVEAIDTRIFLRQVLNDGWTTRLLDSIFNGAGIDTSVRFRPLSHATHLLDAAVGSNLLALWFSPLLANVSSLIYFALCPVLAVLLARRMLGTGLSVGIVQLLAVGALLTSVGYISAGIFIFHPAKKIVIAGMLLQLLLLVSYVRTPSPRLALLIGLCQLLLAWSDETGLFAGMMIAGVAGVFAVADRRPSDLLRLGAFVVMTTGVLVLRFLTAAPAQAATDEKPVGLQAVLLPLLSLRPFGPFVLPGDHFGGHIDVKWNHDETPFNVVLEHIEGAFSMLYGPSYIRWLMLVVMTATMVAAIVLCLPTGTVASRAGREAGRSGAMFLISMGLLLAGVLAAVLLLNFGGRLFMSTYNFYYASFLPVFGFFAVLAAFGVSLAAIDSSVVPLRFAGRAIHASLGIAVAACIVSNVENVPRLNRLIGMIHFNPYAYGQVNEAAARYRQDTANASAKRVMRIAQCSSDDMTRRFDLLLQGLDVRNPGTRADFMYYPTRPFVDERFLRRYLAVLIGQEPAIEFYPAARDEC